MKIFKDYDRELRIVSIYFTDRTLHLSSIDKMLRSFFNLSPRSINLLISIYLFQIFVFKLKIISQQITDLSRLLRKIDHEFHDIIAKPLKIEELNIDSS